MTVQKLGQDEGTSYDQTTWAGGAHLQLLCMEGHSARYEVGELQRGARLGYLSTIHDFRATEHVPSSSPSSSPGVLWLH